MAGAPSPSVNSSRKHRCGLRTGKEHFSVGCLASVVITSCQGTIFRISMRNTGVSLCFACTTLSRLQVCWDLYRLKTDNY